MLQTPDDAEAAFEDAEDALQNAMLEGRGEIREHGVEEPMPEPLKRSGSDGVSTTGIRREATDRCERACQALASMRRSAERLCELTGEADERCASVRQRLENAADLVRRSCSSCG